MAKPFVITAKSDEDLRKEVARQALCDMHFIMATLDRERPCPGADEDSELRFDAIWPSLAKRIDELNCAALSALGNEGDSQELLDIVYGEEGWLIGTEDQSAASGEVSHG